MLVLADPLAAIFNRDPTVISTAALYMKIVGLGFGCQLREKIRRLLYPEKR